MSASIRHSRCFLFFAILFLIIGTSAFAQEDLILSATTQVLGGTHTYRYVEITDGSVLRIDWQVRVLNIECDTFVLDASSMIDGIGAGHGGSVIGWPPFPGPGQPGGGGCYGGRGGAEDAAHLGTTFGTLRGLDISFGSQGMFAADPIYPQSSKTFVGALGGLTGAGLRIKARKAQIEGRIAMDGDQGEAALGDPRCRYPMPNGGGGSGGGVLLLVNDLNIGTAAYLSASGGDGGPSNCYLTFCYCIPGHAGGGGRVKIFYETGILDASAVISATAGRDDVIPNPFPAEDGTVWIQQVSSIDRLLNPSGDLNNDGIVDERDLILLMKQWHEVEP